MGRVRIYDAESTAISIRERFTAKKISNKINFPFSWPNQLQHVGDSISVAYSSDKWKEEGDLELYKHIAESRNSCLIRKGLLRDRKDPGKAWDTIGPMVSFEHTPMPKHFALLAFFEELDLRLFTEGTNSDPEFGPGETGHVQVVVGHAYLGGSKILWSKTSNKSDQPFLFVYTEKEGPLIIIVGDELDIESEGIVG